ncbi:MAG: thioredoxin family protein [Bacteroidetes bacterium]|nr:thioredoxin family protein [Bacteroidota bacterium]
MSKPLTKEELEKEIAAAGNLSLVQFRLDWSGACQIIAPVYEELSGTYSGVVNFYTVDVEKEAGAEKQFGVIELPTILFFNNGKIVDHIRGLVSRNEMIGKIENAIHNNSN